MIKVFCIWCKKELEEPGAILLSPPTALGSTSGTVIKHHLCIHCYNSLFLFMENYKHE